MTAQQFNEKYKQYIPEGWYGLSFNTPPVTEYLDILMEDLITIPGFKLLQVKMKFGTARFYFETGFKRKILDSIIQAEIEATINKLDKQDNAVGKNELFN
jgi:hypothetical protein